MAIFSSKDNQKAESAKTGVSKDVSDTTELLKRELNRFNVDDILRSPRVTEKAALQNQDNVYVFEVRVDASKRDIDFAIRSIYNVKPEKIRTMPIPRKMVQRRKGGKGFTSKGKKAYVYLKEGDSISLI